LSWWRKSRVGSLVAETPDRHSEVMAQTMLIVDDHEVFRGTARLLLEADGFVVVGEAADGASALGEAGRLHPDVVVLAVQLPDMTGFEVSRRLLSEGWAGRVVLVSSRQASEYGELIGESGAIGFISKDELSGSRLADVFEQGERHDPQ
jgi:DNA-binding NarL/FixJ family response regulator